MTDIELPSSSSEKLREALKPFARATFTSAGYIVGLTREDFERARAAIDGMECAQRLGESKPAA